jgi:transposase
VSLKERETLSDLSKRFEVHPTIISKWKQDFSGNVTEKLLANTDQPQM